MGSKRTNDSEYLSNIIQNTVKLPVPVEVKTTDEIDFAIQLDINKDVKNQLKNEITGFLSDLHPDVKLISVKVSDDVDDEEVLYDEEETEDDEEKEPYGEFDDTGMSEEEYYEYCQNHPMDDTGFRS